MAARGARERPKRAKKQPAVPQSSHLSAAEAREAWKSSPEGSKEDAIDEACGDPGMRLLWRIAGQASSTGAWARPASESSAHSAQSTHSVLATSPVKATSPDSDSAREESSPHNVDSCQKQHNPWGDLTGDLLLRVLAVERSVQFADLLARVCRYASGLVVLLAGALSGGGSHPCKLIRNDLADSTQRLCQGCNPWHRPRVRTNGSWKITASSCKNFAGGGVNMSWRIETAWRRCAFRSR